MSRINDVGGMVGFPAIAENPDHSMIVFVRGSDGGLWHNYVDGNGASLGWGPLGGTLR